MPIRIGNILHFINLKKPRKYIQNLSLLKSTSKHSNPMILDVISRHRFVPANIYDKLRKRSARTNSRYIDEETPIESCGGDNSTFRLIIQTKNQSPTAKLIILSSYKMTSKHEDHHFHKHISTIINNGNYRPSTLNRETSEPQLQCSLRKYNFQSSH